MERRRRENDEELARFVAFVRRRTATTESTIDATLRDLGSVALWALVVVLALYLRHFVR
ncbi:hypothetical protein [Sandaracinus amylolyticus]|uniref:hypothetical protein n=1 Tax=Sandaracinus amylolyticus TaxID=927083 RepID=UPI001F1C51E0|nr:hypothetical protein [Sandaracinus amylolyticus]